MTMGVINVYISIIALCLSHFSVEGGRTAPQLSINDCINDLRAKFYFMEGSMSARQAYEFAYDNFIINDIQNTYALRYIGYIYRNVTNKYKIVNPRDFCDNYFENEIDNLLEYAALLSGNNEVELRRIEAQSRQEYAPAIEGCKTLLEIAGFDVRGPDRSLGITAFKLAYTSKTEEEFSSNQEGYPYKYFIVMRNQAKLHDEIKDPIRWCLEGDYTTNTSIDMRDIRRRQNQV